MEKPRPRDVNKFPKVIGPVNGSQNLRPSSLVPSPCLLLSPQSCLLPSLTHTSVPSVSTLVPTLPPQGLGLPLWTGSSHTCPVYTCPPSPLSGPAQSSSPQEAILDTFGWCTSGSAQDWGVSWAGDFRAKSRETCPGPGLFFLSDPDLQTFIFSLPVCLHQDYKPPETRALFSFSFFVLLLFPGTLE